MYNAERLLGGEKEVALADREFNLKFPITIVRVWDEPKNLAGETMDISLHSVVFTAHETLPIGARVEYRIVLLRRAGDADVVLHCWGSVLETYAGARASIQTVSLDRHEFLREKAAAG
jgi:hypothetical protein